MRINTKIHNLNHFIKSILGDLEFLVTKLSLRKNELYVVNYHGTQKKFLPNFRKQIVFYKKYFEIITPVQLNDFYSGKLNYLNKPLLLITFDDGIKNNLYTAEILEEYLLKGYFFVVPEFVNTNLAMQTSFFKKNIRQNINPNLDHEPEDFYAINWPEIKALLNNGHLIGSHTQTHQLVANRSSFENSVYEIETSKMNIAKKLDQNISSINAFCSNHNTLLSVGIKELACIQKNYNFHFTTIAGSNQMSGSKLFIKRINVESFWLLGAVKFAFGRWGLGRWKSAIAKYLQIMELTNLH